MRLTISVIAAVLFTLSGASLASATPISWGPDVYDPVDILFTRDGVSCTSEPVSGSCSSFDYTHDLTTWGFVPGLSSDDQLAGGVLELYLRDGDDDAATDSYKFALELGGVGAFTSGALHANLTFDLGAELSSSALAAILVSLQEDGILNVRLTQQGGPNSNFFLDQSIFTGFGERLDAVVSPSDIDSLEVVATPEPASLVLFGSGLTGLALRLRARKRRQ